MKTPRNTAGDAAGDAPSDAAEVVAPGETPGETPSDAAAMDKNKDKDKDKKFITGLIPHRDPFLWVDRVLEINDASIRAEKTIPVDLDLFRGHYPDYPIMPGVLLCEAVFQAGALLTSHLLREEQGEGWSERATSAVPVLTRILGAKFKREVRPGDTVELTATLKERVGPAWFFKGAVRSGGKVAVQVEFSCMLKE